MGKAIAIFLGILFIMTSAFSQDKGINFQHPLDWKDLCEKAKLENKYIFLDCYTTWCAPCKRMNKEIFPVPEVGDYMNKYFISVKVQMDVTDQDTETVKLWYDEAVQLAKKYEINAYPTFLFLNPDGNLVYKVSTSFSDPRTFIATAEIAIEPSKGVSKLLKKYIEGARDTSTLKYLAIAARNEGNQQLARKVSEEYTAEVLRLQRKNKDISIFKHLSKMAENAGNDTLAGQLANKYINGLTNVFSKDNIAYIVRHTSKLEDRGFKLFVQNYEKINAIMGEARYNYAVDAAKNIIIRYDTNFTSLRGSAVTHPDWFKMKTNLIKKYGVLIADKSVSFFRRTYYKERQQWPEYIESLIGYVNKYPLSITMSGYNEFAWEVFEHSDNIEELNTALEWSKKTLTQNVKDVHANIDTYANLLYKLGRTAEAIQWEERALGLADSSIKEVYQNVLDKMKRNEKTWPANN